MSKRGKLCTALGLLLLLAALLLTAYNLWRDAMASMSVDVVLGRLTPTLSSRQSELPPLSFRRSVRSGLCAEPGDGHAGRNH